MRERKKRRREEEALQWQQQALLRFGAALHRKHSLFGSSSLHGGGAEPFTRAFARLGASSVEHAPPISWRRRWTRCGARAEAATA